MTVMLSETVTHYHEVELSDELDLEKVIDMANSIRPQCVNGYEAIRLVLQAYKNKLGDEFAFNIQPNACGSTSEEINFEYYY